MTIPFEIGVMLNNLEPDRLFAFCRVANMGYHVVHTSALPEDWVIHPIPSGHEYVRIATHEKRLTIDTMFVGFDGQSYSDIPSIRQTVGLVLPEWRKHRTWVALMYCDLATKL